MPYAVGMHPSPQAPHDGHDGDERREYRGPLVSQPLESHEALVTAVNIARAMRISTFTRACSSASTPARSRRRSPGVVAAPTACHRLGRTTSAIVASRSRRSSRSIVRWAREQMAGVVGAGTFGDRLMAPALAGIPEEIAQELALRALYGEQGPVNVVRIGGSGDSGAHPRRRRTDRLRKERASLGRHRRDGRRALARGSAARSTRLLRSRAAPTAASPSPHAVPRSPASYHYAYEAATMAACFAAWFESVARNAVPRSTDRARSMGRWCLSAMGR